MEPPKEDLIQQIEIQAGVEINEIREHPAACISCGKVLGFVALQTTAPPNGSFAFRVRMACEECGPKVATLSLMRVKTVAQ
jgi:hypothetical protein